MSTYRYRGDLRTTGDQLRLRDQGTNPNKKPIEVRADDNDTEVVLKSPSDASISTMDDGAGDDVGKKLDTIATLKATQELENKTFISPKINDVAGDNTYTVVPSELTADVNITLPALEADDEYTFNLHAQTLENKTFNLVDNFLSGTLAQFNASLLDDSFAGLSAEQTLNNKSLVLPKIKDFSLDNTYNFTAGELSADTEVHLPDLTANDEFTFNNHVQILENKTIKDLTYSVSEVDASGSATVSLFPSTVVLKITDVDEDAIINSIDATDTKHLILINASTNDIQIANNGPILTGAGGDIPLPAGASTTLLYDGFAWRVVGKTGFDGGLSLTSVSSNTTAEVGKHYLVDSSSGVVTITLPSIASLSPSEKLGATIRITDAVNVAGTLSGSSYPNQIVIQISSTDTINAAESSFSASEDWSALTSINLNVSGIWVQFMAREVSAGVYEWAMDDPFFNQTSDLVSQGDIANLITLTALSAANSSTPSGSGSLSYNNTNGVFTFTPPDTYTKLESNNLLSTNSSYDRNRANHEGTQLANTISDFNTAVAANSAVAANTAKVSADGSINTHSDVDTATSSPVTGDSLVWDGTKWAPAEVIAVTGKQAILTAATASHGISAFNIRLFSATGSSNDDTNVFSITHDIYDGTEIEVLEAGVYAIEYTDWSSSADAAIGVSKNVTLADKQVDIRDISPAYWAVSPIATNSTWTPIQVSSTVKLAANDILRLHTNRQPDGEDGVLFRITQISKL